ncbi:unnamed protein product [Caenorhabditis angaria]|uniref:SGNH domain-containing protein n=1 Tax=Caenorhabditis angaria TaxID=860376 RepID=A0A9P1IPZ5_9PELO|nr:unnamed protein product [Caenorhabditis angaria]
MDSAWKAIFLYHNMAEHSDKNLYFKMLNQAEDIFTHTWSLCVEMQFYILVPFIFIAFQFCKTSIQSSIAHIILITLSLILHLISNEEMSFNNVFCRVWQFIFGSVAFYLSDWLIVQDSKKTSNNYEKLIEKGGAEIESEDDLEIIQRKIEKNLNRLPFYCFLMTSLVALTYMAFAPFLINSVVLRISVTILTTILIISGSIAEINPMSNRLLVYIGDISYSLYLVHWPIYVYLKFCYSEDPQIFILGISFSVLLAIIIMESFEKFYLTLNFKQIFVLLSTIYLSIIFLIVYQDAIENYVENVKYGHEQLKNSFENITLQEAIVMNKNWARNEYKYLVLPMCYPNNTEHGYCEFENTKLTGKMRTMIVGNSYTPNLADLVYDSFGKHSKFMAKYSYSSCEVLTISNDRCKSIKDVYLQEVSKVSPDVLFIIVRPNVLISPLKNGSITSDPVYKQALEAVKKYEKIVHKKIYILDSISPPLTFRLSKFAELLEQGKPVHQSQYATDFSYQNGNKRLKEILKDCKKCELIDVSHILFNGNDTRSYDETTKLGYYYDGMHLTQFTKQLIYPEFVRISEKFEY